MLQGSGPASGWSPRAPLHQLPSPRRCEYQRSPSFSRSRIGAPWSEQITSDGYSSTDGPMGASPEGSSREPAEAPASELADEVSQEPAGEGFKREPASLSAPSSLLCSMVVSACVWGNLFNDN